MRKQNVRLTDHLGTHRCWLSVEEAERMVAEGRARRTSRRKAPQQIFALIWHPDPSTSPVSRPALSPGDMGMLASIKPAEISGLDHSSVAALPLGRLQALQRLAGHGLLPRNEALEEAG